MERSGDDLPWDELLRHGRRAFAAVTRGQRMTPEEREDLLHDVLLRVATRYLETFSVEDRRASLRTWVSRHVVWGVADHWRARYREAMRRNALLHTSGQRTPPVREEDPSAPVEREEVRQAVLDCLGRLTETQRSRLVHAERERGGGATQEQQARSLGIALETLKESLKVARALLRRCLRAKDLGFPPPGRGSTDGVDS